MPVLSKAWVSPSKSQRHQERRSKTAKRKEMEEAADESAVLSFDILSLASTLVEFCTDILHSMSWHLFSEGEVSFQGFSVLLSFLSMFEWFFPEGSVLVIWCGVELINQANNYI